MNVLLILYLYRLLLLVLAVDEETPLNVVIEKDTVQNLNSAKLSASKLTDIVNQIDVNKDGKITVQELIDWNIRVAKDELQRVVDRDFNSIDKNKDNMLTAKERFGTYLELSDEKADPETQSTIKFIKEDIRKFKAADINNDKTLSRHEYKALLNPWGYPKMLNYKTNKIMMYDNDKDLKLTQQEFTKYFYLTNEPVSEDQKENVMSIFKNYDLDKDGKLSKKELEMWYSPDFSVAAKIEANELMRQTDKNKDGILTLDEIVAKKHMWEKVKVSAFDTYTPSHYEL